ncbi:tRNA (guanine(46)-N(7))-methyltransferase TrmB [Hoeflea sp. YIM 152468]|uniref:tRNA (guanine(46)-N(7))-methyltransferase TrmB n=1 Tax=Hoeflea sp. YIM 152468 TaxID=3031759 RepID=UPI0023DCA9B8|nr:tRNA (guanine(46)-N(7))-methyltransferase TrmB [Hoeflea sp. YIM 152468]MDF1610219.1 tRNA (guanine(46)-N(7))-methyltransferase TrmB [Hoeflea sp. YIM 152468]
MTNAQRRSRATEAFYGRRKGKPLRAAQAEALAALLPAFKLDLSSPPPDPLSSLWQSPVSEIRLEIGFGGGEHLLHRACHAPEVGFIGVEPFVNSMAKLLAGLESQGLENIRLYDDDATRVLDWLPEACLDRIDLLYPDPWPKKKHWKRRFVSRLNLDRFARVLKPGGRFGFASDIDSYVNWTLAHMAAHSGFDWTARKASDWREPWSGWPGTRYEAKAIREGRKPCYLEFVRLA